MNPNEMKPFTLPRVYPILDTESTEARGMDAAQAASALLEGGARILQFRHKPEWRRRTFETAKTVAGLCAAAGATFVVNDRADFAMLLGAGLHVGQDDLAPADARKLLGDNAVLGFSTHNPEQFCAACREPADYLAVGPIYDTSSKRNPDPVAGLHTVARCRAIDPRPLVAIGGITLSNAADVLRAGADSVAVIAGLFPDVVNANSLRKRMEEWQQLVKAV
jgi:thiamine-phosphate pyrophosphorylase